MKNPYEILGLSKTATPEEIKRAYRRLARTWHPDSNSSPGAEERFKEISSAYHLLSDPVQRGRFDRGEIDAAGHERGAARGFRRGAGRAGASGFGAGSGAAGGRSGFRFDFGGFDDKRSGPFDADDLFSDLFNETRRPGAAHPRKGSDTSYELTITFVEAVLGGTRRVSLLNGKTLDVRIAPGTEDGRKLRLKGQGGPGANGGPNGDAMVEIKVQPHPFFRRKGHDIVVDVPITLKEAVLGARITVPTVDGKVALAVPKGSNTGTTLRLKGKGVEEDGVRGDQLVTLKVVLPDSIDLQLEMFVKTWRPADDDDPREKAGML